MQTWGRRKGEGLGGAGVWMGQAKGVQSLGLNSCRFHYTRKQTHQWGGLCFGQASLLLLQSSEIPDRTVLPTWAKHLLVL